MKLFFSKYLQLFASLCLLLQGIAVNGSEAPKNSHFPSEVWQTQSAEAVNIDLKKLEKLFDLSFEDSSTQGAALFKSGKLIQERYAEAVSYTHLTLPTTERV